MKQKHLFFIALLLFFSGMAMAKKVVADLSLGETGGGKSNVDEGRW